MARGVGLEPASVPAGWVNIGVMHGEEMGLRHASATFFESTERL